ncbi:macrophage stimulating factor [Salmonella enterica subsp. enterica serovar Heidelberg str. N418]|nr:macrophage stimulating factor [Salmonella enterica subsp. enterica serovar Heidelberg str. N418]
MNTQKFTLQSMEMLTDGQRYPVAYLSAQEAFLRIG